MIGLTTLRSLGIDKGSRFKREWEGIYIRNHVETSRRGRDTKLAGPIPSCGS